MRKYELVLIISPELTENEVKSELKKYELIIHQHGGQGLKTDKWGKRDLGHRMGKYSLGNYVSITFETEQGTVVDALSGNLRIAENVLKFEVHRINVASRKFKGRVSKKAEGGDLLGGDDDVGLAEAEYV
ncbi:MAG: 30S ribosomal protein S6 [Proteobacteria bacterium]|nr:MAG: 30S ribosomal protein S6 [Pseudomonadota bacterium]